MPEYAHVVRAAPERVWLALVDPAIRRRAPFIIHADLEAGTVGEAEAVSLFRTKRAAWRERVLESEEPRRLLVEQRDAQTDRTRATMAWRLEPIQLGSLVVLDVQAKGLGEAASIRAWRGRWYRKLVEAIKTASEAAEEAPPTPVPTTSAPPEPQAPESAGEPKPAARKPPVRRKAKKR